MNPHVNVAAVAAQAVLGGLAVLALPFWGRVRHVRRLRLRAGAVVVVATTGLAAAEILAWQAEAVSGGATVIALGLVGAGSVAGGGPVATAVLRLADPGRRDRPGPADPDVLHGGAWVGTLERLGITASLLAGWPEGIAIALAIKGLGRYPELRSPAAAERFIIGTFASVLWAAGCAAVGMALLS
ncbi:MAG: hypothetical protein IPJ14_00505 [Kineosporiaceae bacterium]|nr:hypothetical protein [Kineosporiaceae bacterium]